MKKLIVAVVVLLLAAGTFYRINLMKNRKASESGADIQAREGIPVESFAVETGSIESKLPVYGNLKGKNEAPISPKIGGRIVRFYVDNGDRVRAGQTLLQIETKEIQDNVNQAVAGANAAKEQYTLVKKGARDEERTQVENLVDQARQGFEIAEKNYIRMQSLLAGGVVSQQQMDTMKLQYDMAKSQYDNAKQQLSIVKQGARTEEKNMAGENLKMAEAGLSYVKEQLKNATVTSPTAGVVTSKIYDTGTLVGPGMPYPLMTIVDDSAFKLSADIPEVDLQKVRVGQAVEITVDAISGKTFAAKITEINPAASMGTRTYTLTIELEEKDPAMKSGMFARGDVILSENDAATIVPKDAVMNDEKGSYAFVAGKEKAELRRLKMGIINTAHAEVLEGLKEGERVIVMGAAGLKDGDKIRDVSVEKEK